MSACVGGGETDEEEDAVLRRLVSVEVGDCLGGSPCSHPVKFTHEGGYARDQVMDAMALTAVLRKLDTPIPPHLAVYASKGPPVYKMVKPE